MNVDAVKSAISRIPTAALNEANKVGSFVTSKIPFLKNAAGDTFVSSSKVSKNTVIGSGVIALGLLLAFGGIKTICSKVKEIKNSKA